MSQTPFDLVIFDCDGVLVNTEPLVDRVYHQMLNEHGQTLGYRTSPLEFSGVAIHDRLAVTSQRLGWTPPETFLPEFFERLALLSEKELQPVEGIRELIESLTVPICVASNGSREEIVLRLRVAGLTGHFGNAIFSGLEVPHPKPAPDVFLAAARAFNVPPARCIVIEDSIPGVTAAVRAGMKVYGHAAMTDKEKLRQAGALPFDNMRELKSILSNAQYS